MNGLGVGSKNISDPPIWDGSIVPKPDQDAKAKFRAMEAAAAISEDDSDVYLKNIKVRVATGVGVSTREVRVPSWEFFKLEKKLLQTRIANSFQNLPPEAPIFFAQLPNAISSADLLPGRLTARTFDSSGRFAKDHAENLRRLRDANLQPESTLLFNFVAPPPGNNTRAGTRRWDRLRSLYDSAAEDLGMRKGHGREELLATLSEGATDLVVIVAHGDRNSIYLPDGSTVTVNDILALPPAARDRPPLVVLLACETGAISGQGLITMADALMLRGRASAVVAPVRPVPAGRRTVDVLVKLISAFQNGDVDAAIRGFRGPWQVIVEFSPSGPSRSDFA